jgi:U32 family peptidase
MIELLAPAGDFDSLKAAVLNGANAVYLGGKEFSARQSAENFDREGMVQAVRFCHCYEVKIFATMNTLYSNEELRPAMEYAAFLYEIGVDALIVQDLGFIKLLKAQLPEFELHGSTQMSVHNLDGVNLLYEMGIKRVVLARELTIPEIQHIAKNTQAEIEVFVHGALCISFSGQCLLSSMIGGRSGNRGRCAQPCRQEYKFEEGRRAHILSPKDLSTLEFIDEIVNTGVASLKIEGRMKKPEYVAGVVASYKKALAGKLNKSDVMKVTQLFNRGGFTSYNLHEKKGSEMMSYNRPKNWGTYLGRIVEAKEKYASIKLEKPLKVGDGIENFDRGNGALVSKLWVKKREAPLACENEIAEIYLEGAKVGDNIYKSLDIEITKEAEESYKGKDIKRIPLSVKFIAIKDECIKLIMHNMSSGDFEISGGVPQLALKTPTSREKVIEALSKTKDTPFYFEKIGITMDEDIVIPASELNLLRREFLNGYMDILQGKRESITVTTKFKNEGKNNINSITPQIACITGNIECAKAAIDGECEVLFFGGDDLKINKGSLEELLEYNKGRIKILPWVPEIILEEYENKKHEILKYKVNNISEVLCGNMSMYSYLRDKGFEVYLGSGFNIFNSPACEALAGSMATLSNELNAKQLIEVIEYTKARTMVQVHGKIKVMVSRHCFIGSSLGQGREDCANLCENKIHYLKDKMGEEFEVVPDKYCRNHIYNSKILCTIEYMRDIINMNADLLTLNFLDESYEEALLTLRAYKNQVSAAVAGDYRVGQEAIELLEKLKGKITKGHFYRGVQ